MLAHSLIALEGESLARAAVLLTLDNVNERVEVFVGVGDGFFGSFLAWFDFTVFAVFAS